MSSTPQRPTPLQAEIVLFWRGLAAWYLSQITGLSLTWIGWTCASASSHIHNPLSNPERYQTVYSCQPGSAAAPTAGLHFTPEPHRKPAFPRAFFYHTLLARWLDTFAPVNRSQSSRAATSIREWCQYQRDRRCHHQARRQGGRIIAGVPPASEPWKSAAASSPDPIRTPIMPSRVRWPFILPWISFPGR